MGKVMEYWKEIVIAIVVLVIIGVVFWFFNQADSQKVRAQDTLTGQMSSLSNVEFSGYDNRLVIGSDVLEAVARYKDKAQFSILIKTGLNKTGFYAENTSSPGAVVAYAEPTSGNVVGAPGTTTTTATQVQMKDPNNSNYYVNRTAKFDAKLYMDENAEVRLIVFTQRN